MTYGGTRDWAIWVETGSRMASRLYGPGYLYKTEKNARKAVRRMVASGELVERGDRIIAPGLDRAVTVARVRR